MGSNPKGSAESLVAARVFQVDRKEIIPEPKVLDELLGVSPTALPGDSISESILLGPMFPAKGNQVSISTAPPIIPAAPGYGKISSICALPGWRVSPYVERCRRCSIIKLGLWCAGHAQLETRELDGFVCTLCRVADARAEARAGVSGGAVWSFAGRSRGKSSDFWARGYGPDSRIDE